MRKLLLENKAVIRFVLTFSGSYILMVLLYVGYLKVFDSEKYFPDYVTHMVARQSENVIESLGYNAKVLPHQFEPSMKLVVENIYVARIVEGCNGISIILLFIAFIVSFYKKAKQTLLYIFAGSVIIYVTNVTRIAVLAVGLYKYPQYTDFLHSTVFPGIIYMMVFLLWLFWVFKFSKSKK